MAAWLIALHSAHAPWPRVQLFPWLGRTKKWSPTVLTARYSALLTANHETPSMVEQWTEPYPAQSPDPSIFEEPSDEYSYSNPATAVAEKKRGASYPSHILARLVQQRDYVAAERVLDELKALNLPIRKSFVYKHAVIHAITRRDLDSQWDRLEHVAKWLRLFPHAISPRRLTRSSFAWNRLHPALKARSTSKVAKWYYRTTSSGTYYSSRPGHLRSNNWQLNHFRSVLQAVTSSHPIPDIPLLIQFHLITASKGYDFSSRIIPIIATYAPLNILYTYLRQLRSVALKFNGSKKFKGEQREKERGRGRHVDVRTKAKRVMERWWKIAVYSLVRYVSLRKAKEVWKVATRRFKYDVPDYREILARREKAMRRDVNTRFRLSRKISALRSSTSGETYEGLLRILHRTFDKDHILPVKTLFDIMQLSPPLSGSLSPSPSPSSFVTSPHTTDIAPSPSTLPTAHTLTSLRTKFYSPNHPSTRAARIANWALAQMLYHISRGEDTAALLVFVHHFYAVGVPKCVAGLAMREVVLRSGVSLGSYAGAGERMMNERNEGVVKMTAAEFLRTLPSLSLSPCVSPSPSPSQSQSQPQSQSHSQPQSHMHKLIPDASHTSLVYKIVLRATKSVEEVEEVYKEFLGYLDLVQERDWSAGSGASGKGGGGSRGRGAGTKLVQEAYEAFQNAGWRDISSSSLSVSSPSSLPLPSPSNPITSPSPSPSHHQPPSHSPSQTPSQTQSEKPYPHPTPAPTHFDMAHFTHFVYAFARRSSTLDRARQVLNKDMGRYGMGVKLKVEGVKKKKEDTMQEKDTKEESKSTGRVEDEDIRAWTAFVSVGAARFGVKPLQKELEGLLSRLERGLELRLQERCRRVAFSPVQVAKDEEGEGGAGVAAVGDVGISEAQGHSPVQPSKTHRAQQDRPLSLPKALLITYTAIIRFLTTSNRLDDALRIAERLRDRVGYAFPSPPTATSVPSSTALYSSPPPSPPTSSSSPPPSSSSAHVDASPSSASSSPPSSASKSTSAQNDILDAENTDIYDDAHFDIYLASESIDMYEDDESTNNIESTTDKPTSPLHPSAAVTEPKAAQNEKTQVRWKRDEITDWVLQDLMRKLAQRDREE
ncbi:hypothetical protein K474DRAFT_944933 [Panus rudis PR-1116 ss-1]|nr:hypothetical protein K474DRAFT_944933 [Panus rudis PR-1116 ss-1]